MMNALSFVKYLLNETVSLNANKYADSAFIVS